MKDRATLLAALLGALVFGFFYIVGQQFYFERNLAKSSLTPPLLLEEVAPVVSEEIGGSPQLPNRTLVDTGGGFTNANLKPRARSATYLAQMNRPLRFDLDASDPDNDALTFSIINPPAHGSLGPVANLGTRARVAYTPNSNYRGNDTFSFRVTDAAGASDEGSVTLRVWPELIPWTEINLPARLISEMDEDEDPPTAEQGALPGMTMREFGAAALPDWAKISNRVVLTTRAATESINALFPWISAHKPAGLEIIGGLKTAPLFPIICCDDFYDFGDPGGWAQVAALAQEVRNATNNDIVVLENESLFARLYSQTDYQVDLERFRQSLDPLVAVANSGVKFWFWMPEFLYYDAHPADSFDVAEVTSDLTRIVKETVPNAQLMMTYPGRFYWDELEVAARDDMIHEFGVDPLVESFWVTMSGTWDGGRMFTPGETEVSLSGTLPPRWLNDTLVRELKTDRVNIYPKGGDWILVGADLANLLPPVGRPLGPGQ